MIRLEEHEVQNRSCTQYWKFFGFACEQPFYLTKEIPDHSKMSLSNKWKQILTIKTGTPTQF